MTNAQCCLSFERKNPLRPDSRPGGPLIGIGLRNLMQDRLRAGIAVAGVVFAVVLVTIEIGMLLGLVRDASLLIDRSSADIWVSVRDVKTIDFVTPMDHRNQYLIQSVPGVERVEEYNVSWSVWKLPDGGNANCIVIGYDPQGQLGAKLPMSAGSIEALHNQDAIIIDEGERRKLGNPDLGDYVEVLKTRAKVVGFTRGMRSFTTTPFVFTTVRRGREYGWLAGGIGSSQERSVYFLVKVKPGVSVDAVRADIEATVPGVEAHTRSGFSWRTRKYWLLETGVGIGFLAAAFLGLLVGGVIVSQTLFAMTVEKLPEFGVLKAMGASMRELALIVLHQGMLCGLLGLLVGLGISVSIGNLASSAGTAVLIPWPLISGVTVLTVLLCTGASLLSIMRLRRVEPAAVFRA